MSTLPANEKPSRGRPFVLSRHELQSRRDELLALFQRYWASFAWELCQARTPEELRQALDVIPAPRSALDIFLRSKTRKSDRLALSRLRRRQSALRKLFPNVHEADENAQQLLDDLTAAMNGQKLDARVFQYREDYALRRQKAKRRFEKLHRLLGTIHERIEAEEAYVAQHELLGFFGNKRYEYSPHGLANAMAGLPELGWRRSVELCNHLRPANPLGLFYEQFRHVERSLRPVPPHPVKALEQIKHRLQKATLRNQYPVQELRANWFFLEEAVKTAYLYHPQPSAVPFRIFAEYQRRTAAQTPVDRVLAQERAL